MTVRTVTDADILNLKARLGAGIDAWVAELEQRPEVDPDPPVRLAPPQTPTAVPGDGTIVLTWDAPVTPAGHEPTGYGYGRDGTDAAGSGPWSGLLPADARTATLDKLVNGQAYLVTLAAVYPDGAATLTVTATPVAPPAPPAPDPPAAGRRVALAGLSGLGFNSICFIAGSPTKAEMEKFGRDRGRPMDGVLTFPGRNSWDALRGTPVAELRAIIGAGGIVVYSIPHAPVPTDQNGEYTGDAMAINQRGANDAYRAEQRAFGAWLASAGLNSERFVLRPDWEFNGDWYPWSAKNGGPQALKAALRNFITNVRAGGATKVRNDLCENKLPSQSGFSIPDVMPGPEYIDVLGIDMYDMWAPSFTAAQWAQEMTKGLNQNIALAKKLGIQWSIDEGGNTHPADGNHGGDNPRYWEAMFSTVRGEAATCAWHNTYLHPGAPASLRHDFASNPVSWLRYKQLFGNK